MLNELGLNKNERRMMYLSIAYSANVGGTGTLIGTPPNLILMEFITSRYPDHPINFGSWMLFSIPNVILNLFVLWFILQLYFKGHNVKELFKCKSEKTKKSENVRDLLRDRYQVKIFFTVNVCVYICMTVDSDVFFSFLAQHLFTKF